MKISPSTIFTRWCYEKHIYLWCFDCLMDHDIYFDSAYGISASSKDMLFYGTKQKDITYKADLENIKYPKIINMGNFLFGKSVMNTKHFFSEIRDKKFPIDFKVIENNDIILYDGAIDINSGEIKYFKNDFKDFVKAVESSCSILFYKKWLE